MQLFVSIALIAAAAAYIWRTWRLCLRLLIPLLIVLAICAAQFPKWQQARELYRDGIHVQALVQDTFCFGPYNMNVRYSFKANGRQYTGTYRNWDCDEVKPGGHIELLYLWRTPEIHTWDTEPPASVMSGALWMAVLYFLLFAANAIRVADADRRKAGLP